MKLFLTVTELMKIPRNKKCGFGIQKYDTTTAVLFWIIEKELLQLPTYYVWIKS